MIRFMGKVNLLRVVFIASVLVVCTACKEAEKAKVLRLAHSLDTQHPVHRGMVYMAEKLAEKSGGRLTIEIYPSGQLGAEREALELLQIGSLAMTKVSAAVMENFAPNFRVLGLPYIFRDKAHSYKVLDGEIGKELLSQGEKFLLQGLTFYDAGSRSFYSKDKPILNPDDLQGMKIRVMKSNTAVNMINAMGGSPTPISWGELYTALQQGVVDGAENNPPSFFYSRHYEVCKYYSINEHTSVPDVLLIGTSAWNRLSEEEKVWLREAASASAVHQRKLWAESEQESLRKVKEAGVEIIYPDKDPFASKVEKVYDNYKDDPELYALIQNIRAVE